MKTIFGIMLLGLLSGCIGNYGQIRGATNGVEYQEKADGTKILNVSGSASMTIGHDGTVTATSNQNQVLKDIMPAAIEAAKATLLVK